MIAETLITAILAYYVGSMLDFRSATIDRFSKDNSKKVSPLKIIAGLLVSAALVFDIRQIFIYLQNEDGVFDFSGLSSVNWMPVAIVTAVAIVAAIVLSVFDGKRKQA